MNLNKQINKVCNSLTKTKSHWKRLGEYYIYNKQDNIKIWIANKDYSISLWKPANRWYNDMLDKAIIESKGDIHHFPEMPNKLKQRLWKSVKVFLDYDKNNS